MRLVPEKLGDPLRWRAPRMIFVNSMSDLFHKDVPDDFIVGVVRVMVRANWHTFQVLTKRAERLSELLGGKLQFAARSPHIWWGVSVEDRQHGLPRVRSLRSTPAGVRFLSIEPLLEDLGRFSLRGIDWVIVGGESGPGARPMAAEWVRSIRDQCRAARCAIFLQTVGRRQEKPDGKRSRRTNIQRVS